MMDLPPEIANGPTYAKANLKWTPLNKTRQESLRGSIIRC